ncbi:MAG: DNA polymerase III subunit delta [Planctomycetota bacterium]
MHGEESLLRELVQKQLIQQAVGDDTSGVIALEGSNAAWRDVRDDLATQSLFGAGQPLVIVNHADDFVSANRAELEQLLEQPVGKGILLLTVKSWPGNTRLAKGVAKTGLVIACRPPERKAGRRNVVDEGALAKWLVRRAREAHRLTIGLEGMQRVMALAGSNLTLLDQELAKLALFVKEGESPNDELIQQIVGGWREETTWELIDAACLGNTSEALGLLDRLLQSGEAAQALFGAISWSLRRFGKAVRVIEQAERDGKRINLRDALVKAGFSQYPQQRLDENERQLRQLGRERASQLLSWLVETDLRLKRTHSSPERARWALEMLVFRLAQPKASPAAARAPLRAAK